MAMRASILLASQALVEWKYLHPPAVTDGQSGVRRQKVAVSVSLNPSLWIASALEDTGAQAGTLKTFRACCSTIVLTHHLRRSPGDLAVLLL
jgi:hypothetical protein